MLYFDCLCEIGPRNEKDPAAPWSVDDVVGWMDHCGIAGAAVVHTMSIEDESIRARERLAGEIAPHAGRLFPVWNVLPTHAGDFEETPEAFLAALEASDVRAVKLFPESHAYPLSEGVIGPMLAALANRRVLTMIDFGQVSTDLTTAFERLDRILATYPELPLLLQRANWGLQRVVLALMERHDNLHIEMSSYQINRGIEEYVKRFGAERLLFGTGLPAMSAGAARAFVDYALVPQEAKERIAGGNLSRLMKGTSPKAVPETRGAGRRGGSEDPHPPLDSLRAQAAAGRPITDSPVLDAHCHVLSEGGHGVGRVVTHCGDADGLVEIKDVVGIRKTALMSWSGPAASDAVAGNDVVVRALAKYPDRFWGMVYVNPAHLSPEEVLGELRRRVEQDGFRGIKPYFRVGLPYDDPLYAPLWEYANERRMPILLHLRPGITGNTEVVDVLAERYPEAQWMVAHTGGQWSLARGVVAVMKKRPNAWAELTYTTVINGVIEWMVSEVGDDRVLFGTDAPMRDPRPQLGWVVWADLPEQSRRKILGENFARLLAMGDR